MKDSTIKLKYKFIIYITSILFIYGLLFILYFVIGDELLFPSPNAIILRFFNAFSDRNNYLCIANTTKTLIIVILLSFLIGGSLGIIAGSNKYLELFFKPIIRMLQTLPLIILILIIMVIIGLTKTMYYAATLILIPIFYNGFLYGTKSIGKELIDVYRLDSNLNLKVILKVYIPLITNNLTQAFIDALGMGIKIIVMCEYMCGTFARNTLGGKVMSFSGALDYEGLYGYSLLLILVVLILEFIPSIIKRIVEVIRFKRNNNKNLNRS